MTLGELEAAATGEQIALDRNGNRAESRTIEAGGGKSRNPLVDHGITLPAASYVNEAPVNACRLIRREEAALRREARIERSA